MQVEIGSIIEGKVTGITNFGAFVQLPGGKTGLVHISEVAAEYVEKINEHLKVRDVVKVKVVTAVSGGKISLSIKKALPPKPVVKSSKPIDIDWSKKSASSDLSFEDKMNRFKQDSDEKMQDLKFQLPEESQIIWKPTSHRNFLKSPKHSFQIRLKTREIRLPEKLPKSIEENRILPHISLPKSDPIL